jgi:hypothetical protein
MLGWLALRGGSTFKIRTWIRREKCPTVQSDLHFTSNFTVFSVFRVTIISLVHIHHSLSQYWKYDDSCNPFSAWHYLAVRPIYQPEALLSFPNQNRSLRLTCNSLEGFLNSIYDYEQSFLSYKGYDYDLLCDNSFTHTIVK